MSVVAEALGISPQHLSAMHHQPPPRRHRRPPLPDAELLGDNRALIADLPTYGYHRVHALCAAMPLGPGAPRPIPSGSTGS